MTIPPWLKSFSAWFKPKLASWFVGFVLTIMTVFSSKIAEWITFAIHRADLRAKNYEELSADLSEYVFTAEVTTESIEANWTLKDELKALMTDYNNSITNVRKKEYVYRLWIAKYWDADSSKAFDRTFLAIRKFDQAVHSLNVDIERVVFLNGPPKIPPEKAAATAKEMYADLVDLRESSNDLLTRLQK